MGVPMSGTEIPKVVKTEPRVSVEVDYESVVLRKNGAWFWRADMNDTSCCGVFELNNFQTHEKVSNELFAQGMDAFLEMMRDPDYDDTPNCAFLQLVLTRPKGKKTCQQLQLLDWLERKPGCFCGPWRANPNSTNELQVWLISV